MNNIDRTMPVSNDVTLGSRVTFMDGDERCEGIVNGATWVFMPGGKARVYVPVHVPESDRNLYVYADNLCAVRND